MDQHFRGSFASSNFDSPLRQSGDFSVAAGGTEVLGETRLPGSPRSHHVDLDVTVGGRALTCADARL